MTEWGWISYKRLWWQREDGRKLFEGRFKKDNDSHCWTLQVIKFWALYPVKAMSAICRSAKEPRVFEGQTIN